MVDVGAPEDSDVLGACLCDWAEAGGAACHVSDCCTARLAYKERIKEFHAVCLEYLAAAFLEGHLEVVVAEDLDKSVAEVRDVLAVGDAFDKGLGVDVASNVLEELRYVGGVFHSAVDEVLQEFPVVLALDETDGQPDVSNLVENDSERLPHVAQAFEDVDGLAVEPVLLAEPQRLIQRVRVGQAQQRHQLVGRVLDVQCDQLLVVPGSELGVLLEQCAQVLEQQPPLPREPRHYGVRRHGGCVGLQQRQCLIGVKIHELNEVVCERFVQRMFGNYVEYRAVPQFQVDVHCARKVPRVHMQLRQRQQQVLVLGAPPQLIPHSLDHIRCVVDGVRPRPDRLQEHRRVVVQVLVQDQSIRRLRKHRVPHRHVLCQRTQLPLLVEAQHPGLPPRLVPPQQPRAQSGSLRRVLSGGVCQQVFEVLLSDVLRAVALQRAPRSLLGSPQRSLEVVVLQQPRHVVVQVPRPHHNDVGR